MHTADKGSWAERCSVYLLFCAVNVYHSWHFYVNGKSRPIIYFLPHRHCVQQLGGIKLICVPKALPNIVYYTIHTCAYLSYSLSLPPSPPPPPHTQIFIVGWAPDDIVVIKVVIVNSSPQEYNHCHYVVSSVLLHSIMLYSLFPLALLLFKLQMIGAFA